MSYSGPVAQIKNAKKEVMAEGKSPIFFLTCIYNFNSFIERHTEIERENRILLEKMSSIM